MNNSIIYVGMDVHTTNYTLVCYSIEKDDFFAPVQVAPDFKNIVKYINKIKENVGSDVEIICGYEAGCLGYSLYKQLTKENINCVIMAPTSLPTTRNEIKTDRRDAQKLAKCLAFNTYKQVYVPTEEDNAIKEYNHLCGNLKGLENARNLAAKAYDFSQARFASGQTSAVELADVSDGLYQLDMALLNAKYKILMSAESVKKLGE